MTASQRSKEQAHDYRYFPEPDLPPLFVDRAWLATLRARLPELPDARRARYMADFGLGAYDAEALTTDLAAAQLFEATVSAGADAKKAANWIQNDVARLPADAAATLNPAHLAELIRLVDDDVIGISAARQLLPSLHTSGRPPAALVAELNLGQVSDAATLEQAARAAITSNPAAVADYKNGKTTAINFLKGQVMKNTQGKANPAVAESLLKDLLT